MGIPPPLALFLSLSLLALSTGCSTRHAGTTPFDSSTASESSVPDRDAAALDGALATDARSDDAALDAAMDAAIDAGVDAGRDAGRDAATEAGADAAIEAAADAGLDAATDSGADAGLDAGTVADAAVDTGADVGDVPIHVLGAPGADCATTCGGLGRTCLGSGSVGLDCGAHTELSSCVDPAAWIFRDHPTMPPPHCTTSWGTSEVCTNNYNVYNAFCCRCR
jgi:hypothetical protein